jgi:hypothetical protein
MIVNLEVRTPKSDRNLLWLIYTTNSFSKSNSGVPVIYMTTKFNSLFENSFMQWMVWIPF